MWFCGLCIRLGSLVRSGSPGSLLGKLLTGLRSLVYPERAVVPPNVLLPTPWAVSALQDSGPVFTLELMLYLCPSNQPSPSVLRSVGTPPSNSSLWLRCSFRDFISILWWFMTLPKAIRYCLGIKNLRHIIGSGVVQLSSIELWGGYGFGYGVGWMSPCTYYVSSHPQALLVPSGG